MTLLAATLFPAAGWASPILGQIDTFENNTTQGWQLGDPLGRNPPVPNFTPPAVIPTGGPAGAGDHFMLVTADAVRSGGRLTVFNKQQWAGDFLQAGVNAVEVDLKNFGTVTLSMRIAVRSGVLMNSPGYSSTIPFLLPADGQWHHAVFLLDAGSLTGIRTPPPLATVLSNVAEFRILNAAAPSLTGDLIATQVGVDNIRALAVPEPGSLALFLVGGAYAGVWLRRRPRG